MQPKFAEEGTNTRTRQKVVYSALYRYIKEVAAGRRVHGTETLTLNYLLQFVCGADEEPVLGFGLPPQIRFVDSSGHFCPSANTCTNALNLPTPTDMASFPPDDFLFNTYDHAFSSAYFGNV